MTLFSTIARGAFGALALTAAAATAAAAASPVVGEPAPIFSTAGTKGETVDLAALKGKRVVLEWTNHDCPFVIKHYSAEHKNMQGLQARAADEGVVWISVISSAPGEQGYVDAEKANALSPERGASPAHIVLDPKGEIGRLYGAQTTPHMFVIDENGVLVYKGGIDDIRSANPADIPRATNFVSAALDALAKGEKPEVTSARPYGCAVKSGPSSS